MAKNRVVVRTWFNKKTGKSVTRTYTYAHKSKKGLTLVDKRGRILKKNVERFEDTILNSPNYTDAEKRMLIADLKATIKQRKHDTRKLTTSGFMGKQEQNAITRFLANAGYSVDEFADEIGVSVDDVLEKTNWSDGIFKVDNRSFRFNWTYTGQFYEEF